MKTVQTLLLVLAHQNRGRLSVQTYLHLYTMHNGQFNTPTLRKRLMHGYTSILSLVGTKTVVHVNCIMNSEYITVVFKPNCFMIPKDMNNNYCLPCDRNPCDNCLRAITLMIKLMSKIHYSYVSTLVIGCLKYGQHLEM